jgi:UDP-glucose 4-epimerase
MKILVTGAAGLIGSHLVDLLLKDGHSVVGIDDLSFGNRLNILEASKKNNYTFIKAKLQTIPLLTQKFDVIYHLASMKKPIKGSLKSSYVMEENYSMTKVMVEEALRYGSHLIFTSTSDVYGNSSTFSEDEPITIGPPTNERYSYAMSKLYSEQYILNEVAQSDLNATIARVFGCASWRSNKSWSGGHIPVFVHNALLDKDITIHGDGLQTRSICHALDITNGLKLMLNNLQEVNNQIINLGTDQQTTVKEVAEYIVKQTDSRSKLNFETREVSFGDYKEILTRFANTNKAKNLLGFEVKHSTFEVIDEMIEKFNNENSGYYSC